MPPTNRAERKAEAEVKQAARVARRQEHKVQRANASCERVRRAPSVQARRKDAREAKKARQARRKAKKLEMKKRALLFSDTSATSSGAEPELYTDSEDSGEECRQPPVRAEMSAPQPPMQVQASGSMRAETSAPQPPMQGQPSLTAQLSC